jgi:hypothetical protein
LRQPLSQANLHDLPLLFGGFAQLCVSIGAKPALKDRQHFVRAFAGSADDVSKAEALLVARVPVCEICDGSV